MASAAKDFRKTEAIELESSKNHLKVKLKVRLLLNEDEA